MRRSLAITAACAAVPWAWFVVRDAHPVLDLVALGLPVIAAAAVVGCLALAAVRRRWAPTITAASWLVVGLLATIGPWLPQKGDDPIDGVRIVAANTYGRHSDPVAVERQLAAQAGDVLVISEPNWHLTEPLAERHGTVVRASPTPGRSSTDPVLFTDLPARDLGLPPALVGERAVRVQVEGPSGPFVVYGLHLFRPRVGLSSDIQVSVRAHARSVDRLLEAVADEELPVVVAGDLNLVDRTSGYRALTQDVLRDAMRTGWVRHTALRPLGLPFLPRIDHVLVTSGWCSAAADVFELTGSDHRGVAATVGPCPSHGNEPGTAP